MDSISYRYAQALAQLAHETQSTKAWQSYLAHVHSVVKSEPDLKVFLSHNEIPIPAKHELIQRIFSDAPTSVLHFMMLLIDRKRIQYLESIAEDFHHLCNEHLGIQEGIVYSAIPLDSQTIEAIQNKLAHQLNTQLELTQQLDQSLIGGFKVVIGDRVYNNSLTHQLSELRHSIMQGKR